MIIPKWCLIRYSLFPFLLIAWLFKNIAFVVLWKPQKITGWEKHICEWWCKQYKKQRLNIKMRETDEQENVSNDINNKRYLFCPFHITDSFLILVVHFLVFNYKLFFFPLYNSSMKPIYSQFLSLPSHSLEKLFLYIGNIVECFLSFWYFILGI